MSTTLERRRDLPPSAPFYTLPPRKTSAQIIREARHDMSIKGLSSNGGTPALPVSPSSVGPRNSVKTVQTNRPFTPRAKERILFGTSATVRGERPPSSFTWVASVFPRPWNKLGIKLYWNNSVCGTIASKINVTHPKTAVNCSTFFLEI